MKSISRYLTCALLLGLCGVVLAGSAVLYPAIKSTLLSEFDNTLYSKIRALTMFPEIGRKGVDLDFTKRNMPEFEQPDGPEFYQVWLRDGTVLARSASLAGSSLSRRFGSLASPVFYDVTLPDGRLGRAVGIGFLPQDDADRDSAAQTPDLEDYAIVIVVAKDRGRLDRVLSGLLTGLILGIASTLVLSALVIARVVKRGLSPVNDFARDVSGIDAHSLGSSRFYTRHLPRELLPIADQLNHLMARLDLAFRKEQQLTADMAHELFTPLAELRSSAEVAAKWPDDRDATVGLAGKTIRTVERMQSTTEALLSIARCGSGMQEVKIAEVDISALLCAARERGASKMKEKHIRFESIVAPDVVLRSDRAMLDSIIGNLVGNAIEYCPEGGRIACRFEPSSEGAVLTLTNTTDDLDTDDLRHLFEPMWRKDPARTGASHCGLGLALVQAFADVLEIDVRAQLIRENELQMRLVIPGGARCRSDKG